MMSVTSAFIASSSEESCHQYTSNTSHQDHIPHTSHNPHRDHTSHEHHSDHTPSTSPESQIPCCHECTVLAYDAAVDHLTTIGLLTPALPLVPELSEADCLCEWLKELREEDRDVILAAAHIDDARTGRGRYGKSQYYFKRRPAQMAFKVITNQWFQRLIYAAVLLHSLLTFIEPPSVEPQSPQTYVALGLSLICLSLYLMNIILSIIFLSWRVFWTYEERSWDRLEFLFLCCFVIDWILLLAEAASGNKDIVQPFRCLRLGMIMCKARNVGHITNVVRSITIKLGGVVFIILLFILLYSCVGVHLVMRPYIEIGDVNMSAFRPPEQMETVMTVQLPSNNTTVSVEMEACSSSRNSTNIYEGTFNHIGTAAYQLFILLTTENYPVFMFPAYNYSQWYFVYFGTFLSFGVFFVTSILLAIIANLYWQYNKKHVKKERAKQRTELVKAWKLLGLQGQERLPVKDRRLLKLFRLLKPKNTDNENRDLIAELDPEGTGWVDWIVWVTQLLSILALERNMHHHSNKTPSGPACVVLFSKIARKVTAWGGFDKAVLVLIILHTLLFALKWEGMSLAADLSVQGLKTAIVTLFLLEMAVRLGAEGRMFFNLINTLDFTLVIVGLVSNILWYGSLSPMVQTKVDVFIWRGILVVISCLAIFIRLFFNSKQSRQVMTVFFRLFPVMLDLIILFGIVLYFYGILGMEIFHSFSITSNTPDAIYLQYGCGLGFENFKCSLFIIFQILTTSNWHDIMNTVIVSLDSYAPVIYFIPCYVVINLVIMNLLVAIGIEAFNKFSQEQKDENHAPFLDDENTTIKESFTRFWRRLFSGLRTFTKSAFSSARVADEGHDNNSIIDIEVQGHTPGDHITTESKPCLSASSSNRGPTPDTRLDNDIHSTVLINQSACDIEEVEVEDDVFPATTQVEENKTPSTPVFATRQEKMKQLMKERQKQIRLKRPAKTVAAAVRMQSFARSKHSVSSHSMQLPTEVTDSEVTADSATQENPSLDQADVERDKIAQSGPDSGPKFRRGYNRGNWRSEVQDITIINREELHELQKQLSAKATYKFKRSLRHQTSVDSESSIEMSGTKYTGHHGYSRQCSLDGNKHSQRMKDFSSSSVDSTLTLTQLDVQGTAAQERPRKLSVSSLTDNILMQRKLPSIASEGFSERPHSRRHSSLSGDMERPFDPSRRVHPKCSSSIDAQGSTEAGNMVKVPAESRQNDTLHVESVRKEVWYTEQLTSSKTVNETVSLITQQRIQGVTDHETPRPGNIQHRRWSSGDHHDNSESNNTGRLVFIADLSTSIETDGTKRAEMENAHSLRQTPLISVEEVTEPADSATYPGCRPDSHKLDVPGGKHLIPSGKKSEDSSGQGVNKEIPDWVKRLTEQYNVTVHTDNASPQ